MKTVKTGDGYMELHYISFSNFCACLRISKLGSKIKKQKVHGPDYLHVWVNNHWGKWKSKVCGQKPWHYLLLQLLLFTLWRDQLLWRQRTPRGPVLLMEPIMNCEVLVSKTVYYENYRWLEFWSRAVMANIFIKDSL